MTPYERKTDRHFANIRTRESGTPDENYLAPEHSLPALPANLPNERTARDFLTASNTLGKLEDNEEDKLINQIHRTGKAPGGFRIG
jgi:hypothetical protein